MGYFDLVSESQGVTICVGYYDIVVEPQGVRPVLVPSDPGAGAADRGPVAPLPVPGREHQAVPQSGNTFFTINTMPIFLLSTCQDEFEIV